MLPFEPHSKLVRICSLRVISACLWQQKVAQLHDRVELLRRVWCVHMTEGGGALDGQSASAGGPCASSCF